MSWKRRLLSLWAVLHLLVVCSYVSPWDELRDPILSVSEPYLRTLRHQQKWNMFKKPSKWLTELEAVGVRADGTTVPLLESTNKPDEFFVNMGYSRLIKVRHNVVSGRESSHRFREPFARWLCAENPDVDSVQLIKHRVKHPTRAQRARGDVSDREETRVVLVDLECPE
ncbi:MAG: hypothetical protein GY913_10440 [Proteobacteria bacterium]|nr:hypothetical protein [Pseudomonadota bacterium]MCP4917331.1 hypothetical protein [Pseudomonadota bacterium]